MAVKEVAALKEVDVETELKVIVVGNGQVGKTSMITRFATGAWTDAYKKTIGTDFMEKEVFVNRRGETVKLLLWDTAGQEMFSELTRNYYKGAGAVVYVFSTVDRDSFLEIERWRRKVEAECGPIVSVLVQNKVDLLDQAVVKSSEAEDLARRMGVKLYRTCVKDNVQVNEVFDYVAEQYLIEEANGERRAAPVPEIGAVGRRDVVAKPADGAGAAAEKEPAPATGNFKLEPSKRRTDGKKRPFCSVI